MKYFIKGLIKIISLPLVVLLIPVGMVQKLGGAESAKTWWYLYMDWVTEIR